MVREGLVGAEKRVGTLLDGKWHLEAILGYGGSAAVYAATHRNGKRAAIKILHRHCAEDEQLVARFVREGYLANKIGHPGVVSVLDDHVTNDGLVFLVMELLEGKSLDRCGRGLDPPVTIPDVIRIADDLLDILVAAHAIGLIHRDIKPANLFITTTGQLKILDFGIARLAEPSVEATQTGMMMGTPAFMPPEQARARWSEVDARSDLWSLGATLIALLLGRRPRVGETPNEELLMSMTQPLPSLTTLLPEAPPGLVKLIDKAVAFERADRWQSAREMQDALRNLPSVTDSVRSAPAPVMPSVTLVLDPAPTELPVQVATIVTHPSHPTHDVPSALPSVPAFVAPESDAEPAPSLTTHRAVLHSAPPPTKPGSGYARLVAAFVAMSVLALVVGGVLWSRTHRLPSFTKQASTPASPPPPTPSPSPPAVSVATPASSADVPPNVVDPPAPSTTASPSASSAHDPRRPGSGSKTVTRPAPSGSDPSKYFDSRF